MNDLKTGSLCDTIWNGTYEYSIDTMLMNQKTNRWWQSDASRFKCYVVCCAVFMEFGLCNGLYSQTQQLTPIESHWLYHPRISPPRSDIQKARFPVVDIHTHFWVKGKHDAELLDAYVQMMDRNNISLCVSLDGTLGGRLDAHRKFLFDRYSTRFLIFANLDFQGKGSVDDPKTWACNQPFFVRDTVENLRIHAKDGTISGVKFFKDFGLRYKDSEGALLRIDDERWDPIWSVCGELEIPVIMHVADPSAFFLPADERNERKRELENHPEWSFASPEFPSRSMLHEARNRVIAKHPKTIFIGAHLANDGEDLKQLGEWLDQFSNLYVEFASRINELGRQPYSSKAFFEKYQDRILFGTDGPWPEARLRYYWRFLETYDEYFPYSEKVPPPQGDWNIYGIRLDDSILRKIYYENASKLIPGVAERIRPLIK
jgi:predicted TIM-barrel fold metal-dependent hydrolase